MTARIVKIDTLVRESIPEIGTTIFDDLEFDDEHLKRLIKINVYKRYPENCPLGRGNWVVDLIATDSIFCIKLPLEMDPTALSKYLFPLSVYASITTEAIA
jgi:hypothetical protein